MKRALVVCGIVIIITLMRETPSEQAIEGLGMVICAVFAVIFF